MTAPTITALPPLPDAAATFADDADTLLAAIPTTITESNALAEYRGIHDPIVELDALAAANLANPPEWVADTDYERGDVAWSPTDFQDYVRRIAGAGSTDPAADKTNWQLVTGTGDSTLTGAETWTNKTLKNASIQGRLRETIHTITDSGSVEIDPTDGSIQVWELGADRTPTAAAGWTTGQEIALFLYSGGWDADFSTIAPTWVNGIEPDLEIEKYSVIVLGKGPFGFEAKYAGLLQSPTKIDLNFMLGVVDSRVTLTRASAASYVNSSGAIASAAIDAARLDYSPSSVGTLRGLLYEPQRTNLWTYSEDLPTGYGPVRASLSGNATTAPDGTTTADKLIEDSTASATHVVGGATSSGITSTFSVFAKAAERSWLYITSGTITAYFNLSTGAVGTTANCTGRIEDYGDGWYRCIIEMTTATSLYMGPATGNGGGIYSGNGTVGSPGTELEFAL